MEKSAKIKKKVSGSGKRYLSVSRGGTGQKEERRRKEVWREEPREKRGGCSTHSGKTNYMV